MQKGFVMLFKSKVIKNGGLKAVCVEFTFVTEPLNSLNLSAFMCFICFIRVTPSVN